jgi:hypothetical protein
LITRRVSFVCGGFFFFLSLLFLFLFIEGIFFYLFEFLQFGQPGDAFQK